MCGINGIISNTKVLNLKGRIHKMNESIKHRGPDASGVYAYSDKVGFGHRRLSVIDLDTRSNQPMISSAGNVLVYNGEIYNYKEIKEVVDDYDYKTNSDTEVILAAIEKRGIQWLLDKVNGMFAFAYFDVNNSEIFIARDRMGIKPLYYYADDDKFVFSSEIKGVLNSGLVDAVFNESAIDEYLANRYVRAPYTFFSDILQVNSGEYLQISVKNNMAINCVKYWNLPDEFNMEEDYDENLILAEFDERVKNAIQKRMISDVTLGTYLSGGVDSSLITAITALNSNQSINTYTIGFNDLNEFTYAKRVSEKYKTKHHEIIMDIHEYFEVMKDVIMHKDAPLGVPNEIPLAIMSKELKKDITVVLSGEGADELMGGYGRIFRAPYDYVNLSVKKSFYDYFIELYEYVPRDIRDKYLKVACPMRKENDKKIKAEFDGRKNEENVFRFFHEYHVKGLLQRVDTTTMLTGVEARVPFLDHELVEFTYKKIPYELKLKWKDKRIKSGNKQDDSNAYSEKMDTPKYLLRKLARKYLPDDIIDRKKMGFPVPLNSWFAELKNNAKEILKDAYWLKIDRLDEFMDECERQGRSGQILWMFINTELFRKMYFSKQWKY